MKICKYCGTEYDDSLDKCPNCGGNKVFTARELEEEANQQQKEIENQERAAAAPAKKKNALIGVIVAVVVVIAAIAGFSIYKANQPLSNGMTKDEAQGIFDSGVAFMDAGQYEDAIDTFLQLPSDSKQYTEAQELLAQSQDSYRADIISRVDSQVANGDYDSAFSLVEKAQSILPGDAELQNAYDNTYSAYRATVLAKVDSYVQTGDYETALEYLNGVKVRFSNDDDINNTYDVTFSAYKDTIRNSALSEASSYVDNGDYESAINTLRSAKEKIGQDDEISAKETVYYNNYKAQVLSEIETAYSTYGYDEAIGVIQGKLSFFSGDSEFQDTYDYYQTLKPISLFSLDPYKTSTTWGVQYYPSYEDALGNTYSDVYINSGTSLGLAPTLAWAQYYAKSEYKTLSGSIAFDTNSGNGYLEVLSGEDVIYTSPLVDGLSASVDFSVDITGVDLLAIQVRSGEGNMEPWDCNHVMLIGLTLSK